jgi:outer membrane protein assembly factor BamB
MKQSRLLIFTAVVTLIVLVVTASGSGVQANCPPTVVTDWPQFQRDESNTGKTADQAPVRVPVVVWRQFTYHSGAIGIEVTPIVAGDIVYVHAGDGLWAFNKRTGELEWQKDISGHGVFQSSTPAYGGGRIFVATFDGCMFAFDALTGEECWGEQVSQRGFQCPITYHDGRIYIGEGGTGGENNSYYCLDTDGNVLWEYSAPTAGYLWCGAVVVGDYLVFGNVDAVLTSVNKNSGVYIDELDLKDIRPDAGMIRASIAYHDGYVYNTSEAGLDKGFIWKTGFDTATGEFFSHEWSIPIGFSTSTPVIHEEKVFVGQGEHGCPGSLFRLDCVTGEIDWSYPVEMGVKSSPALSIQEDGAYIYFTIARTDGLVYCLRDDGTLAWQWNPPDEGYIVQGTAISDGAVFLGTSGGYLYVLESCPDWDVNQDGYINIADVGLVGLHWGETGEQGWIREDVNKDGSINVGDVGLIGRHWGE